MFWLWIACSVKIPDYLVDPHTFAHPQCSEQDHLRAAGFDEDSAAAAQQHARSRLTQSISSSLKSVQVSTTSVEKMQGIETSSSNYEAMSTVIAHFPYNHLIFDVEPVHRSRDGYRALACVRVSDIEREIQLRHQDALEELSRMHSTLMNTEDVRAFTSLRNAYLKATEPMLQDIELLRSLTDGGSLWGRSLNTQVQQVEQRATMHRDQNPVSIVGASTSESTSTRLGTLLQSQQARVHYGKCQSVDGYLVAVSSKSSLSKGPMGGHVVTYTVDMDVSTCEDPLTSLVTTTIIESQGYHSSQQRLAETAAIQNAALTAIPDVFSSLLPMAKAVQY